MEERNGTGRGLGALSVIWSGEHHAYWKPPRGNGYTGDAFAAGVWPHAEAERMIAHCGPEKKVRVVDASTALLEHLSDYAEGSLYCFYIDQATTWPRMQAAAPALYEALSGVEFIFARPGESSVDRFERLAEAFYRDTGLLAPGKDAPAAGGQPDDDVRRERYDAWIDARLSAARSALLLANTGETENG